MEQHEKYILHLRGMNGTPEKGIKIERDTTTFCQRHIHRFVEIVYFYKGTGKHIVNDEEYVVKSGDVFVLNEGVYHQFCGEGLCTINIMLHAEHMYPTLNSKNFISDFYCWAFGDDERKLDGKNYLYLSDFFHSRSESSVLEILQEYNMRNVGFELVIKNEVCTLLVNMLRKYISQSTDNERESIHKKMIESVMMYMDENVRDVNKTKDVTDKIGYNPVYFSRIFAEYVGMSISQYIRKKKIEYACRLLINTNYTVEKICEDIGYNDLKNFYKTFKSITSMTPNEYRNGGSKKR